MKKTLIALVVAAMLLPSVALASSSYFTGERVIIGEQMNDDVYAAGAIVNIDTTVRGDLLVAGAKIIVNGEVTNDLTAAGDSIDIRGNINDDLRTAGGDLNISSKIGDDLFAAGGIITLDKRANVSGDAKIVGGEMIIKGNIAGDLYLVGKKVFLDNEVGGNVIIRAKEITFGPNAVIKGSLDYYTSEEILAENMPTKGAVTFHQVDYKKYSTFSRKGFSGFKAFLHIMKLLALVLVAWVLIAVMPNYIQDINKRFKSNSLILFGLGLIASIILTLVILILTLSIIGLPIVMILAGIYLIIMVFVKLLAGFAVGNLVMPIKNKATKKKKLLSFLVGAIIIGLIGWIPFVGWAIKAVIYLILFGAVHQKLYEYKLKSGKK